MNVQKCPKLRKLHGVEPNRKRCHKPALGVDICDYCSINHNTVVEVTREKMEILKT